ncbi:helix-turn-helix domain-containing protein [Leucobacter weissii]|uniref:Helix-turn-helix domain-containing protein n=1 Tax=Leucobacter weissii TaxID=1983706 RepID=A0A939MKL6_9MICO|nr:helix-turn-helix domain-containing protein [Leucobacter weissii]MBO1902498.1 helix-turn-helix domain-containing protein [Leucobacter weissii]
MSPVRRAELLADYEAGAPVQAIAAKFRVHRATVFEVVRRAGLPGRDPGLSAETRGRAASLYANGLTLAQVAEQIGAGIDAVRAAVLAEGGHIRPRGRMPRHP